MDRRRAHEAFLDGRMYAIHGEESVLENPVHFGPQFRGLRKVIKLMLARERYQPIRQKRSEKAIILDALKSMNLKPI